MHALLAWPVCQPTANRPPCPPAPPRLPQGLAAVLWMALPVCYSLLVLGRLESSAAAAGAWGEA